MLIKVRPQKGFTIVELLIVIVVIGILAAITIVAFNGIQQRAQNTTTLSAANAWYKGLKQYQAEVGRLPAVSGCLGQDYPYDATATSSGTYQCRQDSPTFGMSEQASLYAALAPYMGSSRPAPTFTTALNSSTGQWKRGISYFLAGSAAGSNIRLDIAFAGTNACPQLGGITANALNTYTNGNSVCLYVIGVVE